MATIDRLRSRPFGTGAEAARWRSRDKVDRSAIRLEGKARRFKNSDQLQAFATATQRLVVVLDAVEEMLANGLERLRLIDMWDEAIPIVVGVLKLGEGIVVRQDARPGHHRSESFPAVSKSS